MSYEIHLADEAYGCDGEIVVTDYHIGDYCGDGSALVLGPDNKVREYNLSHCSCYGPFDNDGVVQTWDSIDEFLSGHEDVTHTTIEDITVEVVFTALLRKYKKEKNK
jgi:hypothetical protein